MAFAYLEQMPPARHGMNNNFRPLPCGDSMRLPAQTGSRNATIAEHNRQLEIDPATGQPVQPLRRARVPAGASDLDPLRIKEDQNTALINVPRFDTLPAGQSLDLIQRTYDAPIRLSGDNGTFNRNWLEDSRDPVKWQSRAKRAVYLVEHEFSPNKFDAHLVIRDAINPSARRLDVKAAQTDAISWQLLIGESVFKSVVATRNHYTAAISDDSTTKSRIRVWKYQVKLAPVAVMSEFLATPGGVINFEQIYHRPGHQRSAQSLTSHYGLEVRRCLRGDGAVGEREDR
jgi:hypothetical protein